MARTPVVRVTANFERNRTDIGRFLIEAQAPRAYGVLLDELLGAVIPNLVRFPEIGQPFLARPAHSVEAANALDTLRAKLSALSAENDALRECVLPHYVVLYLQAGEYIDLLAIRHSPPTFVRSARPLGRALLAAVACRSANRLNGTRPPAPLAPGE